MTKTYSSFGKCHNPPLVRDKPIGAPASVKLVYYLHPYAAYLRYKYVDDLKNVLRSCKSWCYLPFNLLQSYCNMPLIGNLYIWKVYYVCVYIYKHGLSDVLVPATYQSNVTSIEKKRKDDFQEIIQNAHTS